MKKLIKFLRHNDMPIVVFIWTMTIVFLAASLFCFFYTYDYLFGVVWVIMGGIMLIGAMASTKETLKDIAKGE